MSADLEKEAEQLWLRIGVMSAHSHQIAVIAAFIERERATVDTLRAENERLREALQEAKDCLEQDHGIYEPAVDCPTCRVIGRARALLALKEQENG